MRLRKIEEMSDEQHYYYSWIRINYHLHTLSRECRTGNMSAARTTVQDLTQEWVYQDVLVGHSGNAMLERCHFPSTSLGKLATLLAKDKPGAHSRQISEEIKTIMGRLDSMFLRIDRNRKREYQYEF